MPSTCRRKKNWNTMQCQTAHSS